jgi:hypothetical protein
VTRQLSISGVRLGWRPAALTVAAAILVLVYFNNPATSGLFPPCTFHYLTGLYCPGCGSGRALYQLMHGNLAAAFRLNPLAVSLLPVLVYLAAADRGVTVWGRKLSVPAPGWSWVLAATVIVYGIVRNLPLYPFTLLAPR